MHFSPSTLQARRRGLLRSPATAWSLVFTAVLMGGMLVSDPPQAGGPPPAPPPLVRREVGRGGRGL